jgi:hypothetical protein
MNVLIGGMNDGIRVHGIDPECNYWQMQEPQLPLTAAGLFSCPPVEATIKLEQYTRRRLQLGDNAYSYFVISGMSDAEAIMRLFERYPYPEKHS